MLPDLQQGGGSEVRPCYRVVSEPRIQETIEKKIRILQINLNRCRLAQDLLYQRAMELRPDIVVISEPNRQLPYWYNDAKGDASIWVTFFNGKLPDGSTMVKGERVVGICAGDTFLISGYCSPNIGKQEYGEYMDKLASMTEDGTRNYDKVVVAGDFNTKTTCWGGTTTDKRGRVLMETLCGYGVFPLRLSQKYTFYRNGRMSCPDIISVTNRVNETHKGSVVLDCYTASDHRYVLHDFRSRTTRRTTKWQKYGTKELVPGVILNRYDDLTREDLNKVDDADKAELLQKRIVATCEGTLKKVGCATNKKYANYWWSPKIAELRAQIHKGLRKVTSGRKKKSSDQHLLVDAYKETRRLLKKKIAQSKAKAWTEYCKILENDP
ncbi:uncharacterized protein LOC117214901 [Bombus bifarius]|uniref:Uncharacterized protein LOC117214901 n=1 Tax=Bombus bifarius TaxID=103933 RepID=A0A6P8NSJ5_9HYME|nr:uncharacterized protein LOC117214901 [Bombus bifarius]